MIRKILQTTWKLIRDGAPLPSRFTCEHELRWGGRTFNRWCVKCGNVWNPTGWQYQSGRLIGCETGFKSPTAAMLETREAFIDHENRLISR